MSLDMTDKRLGYPKAEPRIVSKKRREKVEAKAERAAREIVRKRDGGKCRIPGCKERAVHLHHIVYRSKSKRLKWHPANLVSLCAGSSCFGTRGHDHDQRQ